MASPENEATGEIPAVQTNASPPSTNAATSSEQSQTSDSEAGTEANTHEESATTAPPRSYAEAVAPKQTHSRWAKAAAGHFKREPLSVFLECEQTKYDATAVAEFEKLCNQHVQRLIAPRVPTDQEKRLIGAILDGSVTVRAAPDFFAQLFTAEQLLTFAD